MISHIDERILCLRADNPSPMTGAGTNSYVLRGPMGAVVIDPGPDLPQHRAGLMAMLDGAAVAGILITHAHIDHSEMAPWLAAQTGAQVMSFGAADVVDGGEGVDRNHRPDRHLAGGALALAGLDLGVIHTPGHMGGHLCFALGDVLFSGDHVMSWSTTLIAPPEGDMGDYRASLAKLQGGGWRMFLPGHGDMIAGPEARLRDLIAHRAAREDMILAALSAGDAGAIAAAVYTDLRPALLPAATRNVLAHLIDLTRRNLIAPRGPITLDTRFDRI